MRSMKLLTRLVVLPLLTFTGCATLADGSRQLKSGWREALNRVHRKARPLSKIRSRIRLMV